MYYRGLAAAANEEDYDEDDPAAVSAAKSEPATATAIVMAAIVFAAIVASAISEHLSCHSFFIGCDIYYVFAFYAVTWRRA